MIRFGYFPLIDARRSRPGRSVVFAALEINVPAGLWVFGTAWGENVATLERDGFIFSGAENAWGQADGIGPGLPGVVGAAKHPPPFGRGWADFEEQNERSIARLEEDRVPARLPRAIGLNPVGDFDGLGPSSIAKPGEPDGNVFCPFARAAEKGAKNFAARFRQRRGMAGSKRRRTKNFVGT